MRNVWFWILTIFPVWMCWLVCLNYLRLDNADVVSNLLSGVSLSPGRWGQWFVCFLDCNEEESLSVEKGSLRIALIRTCRGGSQSVTVQFSSSSQWMRGSWKMRAFPVPTLGIRWCISCRVSCWVDLMCWKWQASSDTLIHPLLGLLWNNCTFGVVFHCICFFSLI